MAPPRPPAPGDPVDRAELEALIEEARRRARRRRRIYAAVATSAALVAVAVVTIIARAGPSQVASPALGTPVELSAATANSRIAFLRDPDGDGLFGDDIELWVMNPDGSGQRRLTPKASLPVWSPDARRIAFVRSRLGAPLPRGGRAITRDIYVLNADGSGERRLTSGPAEKEFPAWSPDGRKIAFTRTSRPNLGVRTTDLYVMNADGSGERRLTSGVRLEWFPGWSPDGRKLVFQGTSGRTRDERKTDIYVVDADGRGQRKLTHDPGSYRGPAPAWSPDGRMIAFSGDGAIYVMNADGSDQRKLAPGWLPVWSPDGRKIAFLRDGELYVMNADGSDQRRLGPSLSDVAPSWSPDGRQILFAGLSGEPLPADVLEHGGDAPGNTEIFVANVDGSGTRNLTRNPGDDISGAWSAQQKK